MATKGKTGSKPETGVNLGFEAKLWAAADALRNNMDAAEYKHVVLGLIFHDPCCGSGGMFVQSEKFIEAHSGKLGDISIYGQESNYTTWRLAKMNLSIRGIDAQIAHGDTFHNHQHPDLKADYVLANPPFNDSDWRGDLLKNDKRWAYGVPPAVNANYAWV